MTPVAEAQAGTVVTGIGVVAPNGFSTEEYWSAVLRGESGIRRISRFDPSGYSATIAGEMPEYDPAARLPGRLLPQTDRMTRLALIAAEEAFADAGVNPVDMPPFTCGVVTAASAGGFEFGQKELEALWSKGGRYVSAYQSFAWFYPVNTGQISIRHALRGPGCAIVTEQAGGLDAVAKARRHLRSGTSLMITGGVDGSLSPWSWLCILRSGRISTCDDPRSAFVPFDRRATGSVVGEGGALLVMENAAEARRRGAEHSYGEVIGYAATFDPRPGSGRPPGLHRVIELALADARLTPPEVGVVFADASGDPELDRIEAETIARVFGPRAVPVSVPKTTTGRLLAGGAALDLATALLSLRDGVVPPAVHVESPAHEDLIDLVRGTPREGELTTALILARGQGGFNSALVVRKSA